MELDVLVIKDLRWNFHVMLTNDGISVVFLGRKAMEFIGLRLNFGVINGGVVLIGLLIWISATYLVLVWSFCC